MDKLTAAVIAILALGFLILIHEWGHLWVALRAKMTVQEFSIGFGPPLLRWQSRSGILYTLRLILFGGFVRIKEIEEDLLQPAESPWARPGRDLLRRAAVIAAGPAMNIVAAIILFFVYSLWAAGLRSTTEIAAVSEGSPAEKAGLQPGDEILAIGYLNRTDRPTILRYISSHPGRPVRLRIRRNGTHLVVTPIPNRKVEYYPVRKVRPGLTGWQKWREILFGRIEMHEFGLIGVTFKMEPIPAQPLSERLVIALGMTLDNLWVGWQAVTAPFREPLLFAKAAGPIRMTYEFVAYRWLGFMDQIRFIGIISFALALINLFPIPVLDGGRLLFLFMEFVARRRIQKLELSATYISFTLLILLIAFIALKDIHYVLFTRGQ
ncbi:MAG: M50 family metallopeptidase [Armatimonadetes bacterium]|nr:M50 family metallopeptidase [Armatimonadota bacterium]MDW8122043.1 M50 family metallopeptidase [Armatimonadota bacterium]